MSFLERQLEDPVRFARIKRGFYVFLAVVIAAEIVLPLVFPGDPHHLGFESFPAFGSLYGLISCVAIIVLSKLIGVVWLMKREDHYDD
ncbi:MAG: hypothetical protein CMJ83_21755 [Planctomycetes bacterium]|nr:hypothetical protein [Planctomycetota bacterium]